MTQEQALSILKTGVSVFLTGEPGSGKTHTVNAYVSYLREQGVEPAITASTGIAATHIGGVTIHSWSGIGIKTTLTRSDLEKISDTDYLQRRISRTQALIIDEVSMLSAGTLDLVDRVCQQVKNNSAPFGGLQVVLVGDFFQLPPIMKAQTETTHSLFGAVPTFAYESSAWDRLRPAVCYITEQHRQDDSEFLGILSAIRAGTTDESHCELLLSRCVRDGQTPATTTKLFSHNIDVDRVNLSELMRLPSESHQFEMSSRGAEGMVLALQKGCLSPESLSLKRGASVMFTKNNPRQGFVNGTLGMVESFDDDSGFPVVRTRDGKCIEVCPMDWSVEEGGKVRASITQLPLRLAWAMTVHKSQGMSLDAAVMDLRQVFEYGQGYVALSRVRRLSGLHLYGWNERALQVHPQVAEQDTVFRNLSQQAELDSSRMGVRELAEKHGRFIGECGGKKLAGKKARLSAAVFRNFNLPRTVPEHVKKIIVKNKKLSTCEETLFWLNQGKGFSEIANTRNLSPKTILGHIEQLVELGNISRSSLLSTVTPALRNSLPTIHDTFSRLKTDRLTPVYEEFSGKYSYEDLRLARVLMEKVSV